MSSSESSVKKKNRALAGMPCLKSGGDPYCMDMLEKPKGAGRSKRPERAL
jgi:hypothetical protein